jgi:hypothetical protein
MPKKKSTKKNPLAKFTPEQLYAELNRREVDKEMVAHKVLNVDGFTAKDVVCMQGGKYDDPDDGYGPYYAFYLKVDGKLFDFYYQSCITDPRYVNGKEVEPSRWPKGDNDDYGSYAVLELVPPGFAEAMENAYEYHGKGDIKKHLAKYGITDFRIWNPELYDEKTDRDKNCDV